jgi:hypothetical protein
MAKKTEATKAPAKKAAPKKEKTPQTPLPQLKKVEVKPIGEKVFAVFIDGKQKVYTNGSKSEANEKAKAIKKNMAAQVSLFMQQNRTKAEAIELTNTLEF